MEFTLIKVSVIIPVYNTSQYLTQCIESVTSQTMDHYEVIIIDDYSTDNSIDIINSFRQKNKRIQFLHNTTHSGAGVSRNRGIKAATGEYFLFLDSDDFLSSNLALEKLYNKAIATDSDIVLFKHHILNNDTKMTSKMLSKYDRDTWKYIETEVDINKSHSLNNFLDFLIAPAYPWNKLIKRELLISNNITCTETFCHNDLALSWKSMVSAKSFAFLPESLIIHRHAPALTQLTNDNSKKRLDLFHAIDDVNDFLLKKKPADPVPLYYLRFKWDCFFWGIIKIAPKYRRTFAQLINKDIKVTQKIYWKKFLGKYFKEPREKIKIYILRYIPFLFPILFHIFKRKTDTT